MANPFWHNPEYALKQIKTISDDWKYRSKELTYIDKKGHTQQDDEKCNSIGGEIE